MIRYRCLFCLFVMMARTRPKACPACGKVSHEDMIVKEKR